MKKPDKTRTRIKDIAERTGYSIATVSRVINESGIYYSKETYRKIKKAVEELNYHPDAIARGLKIKRTFNIAFLEPWNSEFFAEIFKGIQVAANKKGYSVAIFSSNYNESQEDRNIKAILSNRHDGVIIPVAVIKKSSIEKLIQQKIPLVLIEKIITDTEIPVVSIKNLEISQKAVSYLIDLGHKKIGFMGEPLEVGKMDSRFKGYKAALNARNIKFNPEFVFIDEKFKGENFSTSYKYIVENIDKIRHCTALFITSDKISITAIKVFKEHGLEVPRDVSIIGFDGLEISKYVIPSLTTVVQPRYDMGFEAMKMLIEIINKGNTRSVELKAELSIGQSTAPPATKKHH